MNKVKHLTTKVNGLDIFYREAGKKGNPVLVLLHGYPTSSHMYRNLLRDLSDKYHLIAPDYPGFGRSEQPSMADFKYTFENFTGIIETLLKQLEIQKFSLYLMDYGAPIGFRIASRNPQKIENLIIQNGCAYEEGLETFWDPIKVYWNDKTLENGKPLEGFHSQEGLQWQYTHGLSQPELVSPDNWEIDLRHILRPENNEIQLALFYDYQTNVKLYHQWQEYFRIFQPRTLIVYGKNDYIFPVSGAEAFKKDLTNLDFNLYDAGHFALESHGAEITEKIRTFLSKN